jgi:cysteine desulfuration protein SufE
MPSDTIQDRAEGIIREFSALEDWVARYRHLVALGEAIPAVGDGMRTEEHAIPGCEYDLWVRAEYDPERDAFYFEADSDAKITRGIAALILRVLNGQPAAAVEAAEFEFLDTIGLRGHLSARRSTGLEAMIHWIKRRARECRNGADVGSRDGDGSGG